ncbi:hypothetical protein PCASD_07324 [Puccinia coronata f. sp. avenae]|uniref:Uncharacterized protein n=1 Tax=Puccinia coronata f. sp. avenae TaxID=200324 RepID=A0A2N5URJ5_9BASI|nr:hypothetical protein PCASD_07324 [Puccinia coronata f. sp. avenae]
MGSTTVMQKEIFKPPTTRHGTGKGTPALGFLRVISSMGLKQLKVTSTSAKSTQKQKKKKKQSSTSLIKTKSKGKKANPKDFYMKLVLTKRQAEMTKAHAEMTRAWAKVTNAKVRYMKQLKDLGLPFSKIEKLVDKEFPPIQATQKPDALADSNLEDLDSDDDSI